LAALLTLPLVIMSRLSGGDTISLSPPPQVSQEGTTTITTTTTAAAAAVMETQSRTVLKVLSVEGGGIDSPLHFQYP